MGIETLVCRQASADRSFLNKTDLILDGATIFALVKSADIGRKSMDSLLKGSFRQAFSKGGKAALLGVAGLIGLTVAAHRETLLGTASKSALGQLAELPHWTDS